MTDNTVTQWLTTIASTTNYERYAPLLIAAIAALMFAVSPAAAAPADTTAHAELGTDSTVVLQTNASKIGNIYCDTGVEAGIDVAFTALAGLGLPITALYLVIVGVKYMKASTEQQKKEAKNSLTTAAIGFAIIVMAILSPELISKVGKQVGYSFSNCVKPF